MPQEAESPPTLSMYPEEYTLTESIAESDSHSSTSDKEVWEEEIDDSEDEDECQWKLYKKITVLV